MLILLSPSKTSDPEPFSLENSTYPVFMKEISELTKILQNKSKEEIKSLLKISDKLTDQSWLWIQSLNSNYTLQNSRCAIYNFTGEVYVGLNAKGMNNDDIEFAQQHLRILSGLYGVLRPLDLVQLYRLEMATKLLTVHGKNLYRFWGDKITTSINADLQATNSEILVNLASDEYFKSINVKKLKAHVVTVDFFELKNDKNVFVSFNAKKARGIMANFIIKHKILTFDGLLNFNYGGYSLDNYNQNERSHLIFVKK